VSTKLDCRVWVTGGGEATHPYVPANRPGLGDPARLVPRGARAGGPRVTNRHRAEAKWSGPDIRPGAVEKHPILATQH